MRNAKEDLAFINTNRFKGSKVKEIIEYWIHQNSEARRELVVLRQVIGYLRADLQGNAESRLNGVGTHYMLDKARVDLLFETLDSILAKEG